MRGDVLVGIGQQIFGASTFSSNWIEVINGTNYFSDNATHLFMNFWSLAVEEQFYLVWPFVTLLLRVRGNTAVERRAIARRRELDHAVAALVAKAVAEGDVRDDVDPELTARLLFGMVNSLVEWYRPSQGSSAESLADAVCAITFDGLRVRK